MTIITLLSYKLFLWHFCILSNMKTSDQCILEIASFVFNWKKKRDSFYFVIFSQS